MADTPDGNKPSFDRAPALVWLTAGLAGLISVVMLETARPPAIQPAAPTLQQAMHAFDNDNLAGAAAAFRSLAARGNVQAEYWYGHALEHGLGIAADTKQAVAEYRKAWAGGVAAAGRRLGELAISGNAGAPDFTEGRSLLLAAARGGDVLAQRDLGHVLRAGIGGPADPVGAYAWLEVAALGGNADARIQRNQLLPKLSADQQNEAAAQVKTLQAAQAGARPAPAKAGPAAHAASPNAETPANDARKNAS
jgi:hypothetical protein